MNIVKIAILLFLPAILTANRIEELNRHLTVNPGDEIVLTSPNYPNSAPIGSKITWDVTGSNGAKLLLKCEDIRLTWSTNCVSGYFMIFDGRDKQKYCGFENQLNQVQSLENQLKLQFDLNYSLGVFKCTIKAIAFALDQVMNSASDMEEDAIELQPTGEPYDGINLNPIPINANLSWNFITNPEYRISVFCHNYILDKCDSNIGVLIANDSINVKKACGSKLEDPVMISSGNRLKLEIQTDNWRRTLKLDCFVQAVTGNETFEFRNLDSIEIDSSNHGIKPGHRITTCKCGWSFSSLYEFSARSINGERVMPDEYPWMVSLNYRGRHRCGGAVITAYHVLTASHCTNTLKAEDILVYVGTTKISNANNGQILKVSRMIGYDTLKFSFHDIAIVVTSEKIRFTGRIGPVCMPASQKHLMLERQYVMISGWGHLGAPGGNKIPQDLMKVRLRVTGDKVCSYFMVRKINTTFPEKICFSAKKKDVCPGDSGSPVVWLDPQTNRYTLVATISGGYCNESAKMPAIGNYVPYYINWIKKIIEDTMPGASMCH